MDVFHEKALIDVAVLFLCGALAVFAGTARAAATFGFVTASVEASCWVGNNLTRVRERIAMRINGSSVHYPSMASRASAFGAEFAVALLITHCV